MVNVLGKEKTLRKLISLLEDLNLTTEEKSTIGLFGAKLFQLSANRSKAAL